MSPLPASTPSVAPASSFNHAGAAPLGPFRAAPGGGASPHRNGVFRPAMQQPATRSLPHDWPASPTRHGCSGRWRGALAPCTSNLCASGDGSTRVPADSLYGLESLAIRSPGDLTSCRPSRCESATAYPRELKTCAHSFPDQRPFRVEAHPSWCGHPNVTVLLPEGRGWWREVPVWGSSDLGEEPTGAR
jgi:hypothetical protein